MKVCTSWSPMDNNGLCWLWPASAGPLLTPCPQTRSPFKLGPGDHSTSACTAEVLVISWAATVPSSGHEPCLFWILTCGLILTRPQTSFITKQLLMDWVFGCHPQACPACCAWLLWGCTLTARRLPCQLHCAWLPAPFQIADDSCCISTVTVHLPIRLM